MKGSSTLNDEFEWMTKGDAIYPPYYNQRIESPWECHWGQHLWAQEQRRITMSCRRDVGDFLEQTDGHAAT